jgi:hypothetical protein
VIRLILLAVGFLLTFLVCGKIASKAGYAGWYGLLMCIPLVNCFVALSFALSTWPIEVEREQLRLQVAKLAKPSKP